MRKITTRGEALNELVRNNTNVWYMGDEEVLDEYIKAIKDSHNLLMTSAVDSEAVRRGCVALHSVINTKAKQVINITDVLIIFNADSMSADDLGEIYSISERTNHFPRVILVGDILSYMGIGGTSNVSPIEILEWDLFGFVNIDLRIKRKDTELESTLESLRLGDISAINWFNSNCKEGDEPIKILASSRRAYKYTLDGYINSSNCKTIYTGEKKGNICEEEFPTYIDLHLYFGQRIMFISDDKDGAYKRGDIGYFYGFENNSIKVRIDDYIVYVKPITWHKYTSDYVINEFYEEELILRSEGEFTQLPIIPADALSYNASRGLTFESIEISPVTKYTGELYNLLCRAKSSDGIKLITDISVDDVKLNDDMIYWYRHDHSEIA